MKTPIYKKVQTGERVGRLTIIDKGDTVGSVRFFLCRCDCGTLKQIDAYRLYHKEVESCGCLRSEMVTQRNTKHDHAHRSGFSPERLSWAAMKARCTNPKYKGYKNYGGRGITVCDRWFNSFESFLEDMGHKPTKSHQLERVENDGNYDPDNCIWATPREQSNNRRNNIVIGHNGESLTLAQWSRRSGIAYGKLLYRFRAGWTAQEMLEVA